MDQGRQAGHAWHTAVVSSLSIQPSALAVERAGLKSGEPVAIAGAAEENQPLVAHQLATAASEGWAIGDRFKEGGRDGEVSEKSLALRHLQLFSYRQEADLARSWAIGVALDGKTS
jgi:hypothetical protein